MRGDRRKLDIDEALHAPDGNPETRDVARPFAQPAQTSVLLDYGPQIGDARHSELAFVMSPRLEVIAVFPQICIHVVNCRVVCDHGSPFEGWVAACECVRDIDWECVIRFSGSQMRLGLGLQR